MNKIKIVIGSILIFLGLLSFSQTVFALGAVGVTGVPSYNGGQPPAGGGNNNWNTVKVTNNTAPAGNGTNSQPGVFTTNSRQYYEGQVISDYTGQQSQVLADEAHATGWHTELRSALDGDCPGTPPGTLSCRVVVSDTPASNHSFVSTNGTPNPRPGVSDPPPITQAEINVHANISNPPAVVYRVTSESGGNRSGVVINPVLQTSNFDGSAKSYTVDVPQEGASFFVDWGTAPSKISGVQDNSSRLLKPGRSIAFLGEYLDPVPTTGKVRIRSNLEGVHLFCWICIFNTSLRQVVSEDPLASDPASILATPVARYMDRDDMVYVMKDIPPTGNSYFMEWGGVPGKALGEGTSMDVKTLFKDGEIVFYANYVDIAGIIEVNSNISNPKFGIDEVSVLISGASTAVTTIKEVVPMGTKSSLEKYIINDIPQAGAKYRITWEDVSGKTVRSTLLENIKDLKRGESVAFRGDYETLPMVQPPLPITGTIKVISNIPVNCSVSGGYTCGSPLTETTFTDVLAGTVADGRSYSVYWPTVSNYLSPVSTPENQFSQILYPGQTITFVGNYVPNTTPNPVFYMTINGEQDDLILPKGWGYKNPVNGLIENDDLFSLRLITTLPELNLERDYGTQWCDFIMKSGDDATWPNFTSSGGYGPCRNQYFNTRSYPIGGLTWDGDGSTSYPTGWAVWPTTFDSDTRPTAGVNSYKVKAVAPAGIVFEDIVNVFRYPDYPEIEIQIPGRLSWAPGRNNTSSEYSYTMLTGDKEVFILRDKSVDSGKYPADCYMLDNGATQIQQRDILSHITEFVPIDCGEYKDGVELSPESFGLEPGNNYFYFYLENITGRSAFMSVNFSYGERCLNSATNYPACDQCPTSGHVMIGGKCVAPSVVPNPITFSNIAPGGTIPFKYTANNLYPPECQLLANDRVTEVTGYNPIDVGAILDSFTGRSLLAETNYVLPSNLGPGAYGYYIKCRNILNTNIAAVSVQKVTVNVACPAGKYWNASSSACVDPGWTDWVDTGVCSGLCGENGLKPQSRSCVPTAGTCPATPPDGTDTTRFVSCSMPACAPVSTCGDGKCEAGETPATCPKDCKIKIQQF